MLGMNVLIVATLLGAAMYGEDITVPMDGNGSIVIRNASFIRVDQFNIRHPELSFDMVDNSVSPWTSLKLRFDMGGYCKILLMSAYGVMLLR